ncbi:MAG: hypothetical protein Q4F15_00750 [Bacillota bacterium]|nr:hypothetical protein [Bacillota bacterium]
MFKKFKILWAIYNCLEVAALITLGVLCLVYANNPDAWKYTLIITGIAIIIDASIRLLGGVFDSLVRRPNLPEAIGGSAELALGITTIYVGNNIASATALFQYAALFIGIALIAVGFICLVYSFIYLVNGISSRFSNIVNIIVEALAIILGIVVLVYLGGADAAAILEVSFRTIGIIFLSVGVIGALGLLLHFIGRHKGAEEDDFASKEEEAQEAEFTDK